MVHSIVKPAERKQPRVNPETEITQIYYTSLGQKVGFSEVLAIQQTRN